MTLLENNNPLAEKKIKLRHLALYAAGLFSVLVVGAAVGVIGYLQAYAGKIYPGVYIDSQYVGELDFNEVRNILENFNNKLFRYNLTVILSDSQKEVSVDLASSITPDNAVELIKLDTEATLKKAVQAGRDGDWRANVYWPLHFRLFGQRIPASVVVDQDGLLKILQEKLDDYGTAPNNATVRVVSLSPLNYETVAEKTGIVFDYNALLREIIHNISNLNFVPVTAAAEVVEPTITTKDLPDVKEELPILFSYGDINLNYIDSQTQARQDWKIPPGDYSGWLEVQKDGGRFVFGLSAEAVKKYLEGLKGEVERPAEDAKFNMENGKAKEFKTGRSGVVLDVDKTYQKLNQAFVERNYHPAVASKTISLSTNIIESEVKLSDINDLGITAIIGSGTSTFYGSHLNRIKNIGHAAALLNGTIIKPEDEFSTLKSAGPFTEKNGYLPELVIKGTEIKKEVGGGMCQIGTTLFRMAMNSGMPIVERRNHSLVVNYYLDPVNRNPGTDATVYDPIVDFKFLNDTGSYLLLQTEVDYKKQLITFTLWGQPDGRRGWYSHPLVKRWIPAGKKQEIEVDNLKPGVKECQEAYVGASASFVYTRLTPDGKEIKRVFDSYYRPLPEICRIGKALDSTCPKGKSCPIKSGEVEAASDSTGEVPLSPEI